MLQKYYLFGLLINKSMEKKAIFLFFALVSIGLLRGTEIPPPPPQLVVGGGYFDANEKYSGGLFQLEYRFGCFWFCAVRPQVVLITPEFRSFFIGAGIGAEFHATRNILLIPSFTPGLYFKGNGRDLGYPIEFRSSIEAAYEWTNKWRLGGQFYHISNASLGHHNPGANAIVLFVAIPFSH